MSTSVALALGLGIAKVEFESGVAMSGCSFRLCLEGRRTHSARNRALPYGREQLAAGEYMCAVACQVVVNVAGTGRQEEEQDKIESLAAQCEHEVMILVGVEADVTPSTAKLSNYCQNAVKAGAPRETVLR
ncbi:uncharacterized protein SPSK_06736 [Sporothrix schenckii 1099-18]|uniref:Uncharacterized protein n=1 Tax=Sporothrix schenckii 1099-18 TaxID=1397361 RepID=A0A0F2MJW4_SPOSC|nr:uncharacterized protein SPSK_06736 [Sporothrix schenckii 1099-18]KJR89369.1 hypothetical protein SPSK_06736 [Sporothrix schenckii 1099-18]